MIIASYINFGPLDNKIGSFPVNNCPVYKIKVDYSSDGLFANKIVHNWTNVLQTH